MLRQICAWWPQRRKAVCQHPSISNILLHSQLFWHACATPLNSLILAVEQLESERHACQHEVHYKAIKESTQRIKRLLESVNSSQITTEPFCPIRSIHHCESVLNSTDRVITTAIDPIFNSSGAKILGNQLLFEEAIVCLLQNAIQSSHTKTSSKVIMVLKRVADQLRIDIIDFGQGSNKLTERLSSIATTAEPKSGTHGWGLWVADYVFRRLLHGSITVHSQPGLGTRFIILLPTLTTTLSSS